MKDIVIVFLLFVLYDAYIRKRDKDKYLTREEYLKLSQESKPNLAAADYSTVNQRLTALENSPYA